MAELRDAAGFPREITQLRRLRVSFDDIATRLGVTREQAAAIYAEALKAAPELTTASLRAEEATLADDAIRDLMSIARQHDPSARTSVEAWNSIRAWAEHKARLAGLFAPQQQPEVARGRLHELRQQARPGA